MNRLTSWKVYQGSASLKTSSITYNDTTGVINFKSDLNNYTMSYGQNGAPPHALTSISGTPSIILSTNQAITYTDFKKVKQITEGNNILNISYGTDQQRIKTVLTNSSGSLTHYYMGNYEEEIRNGNTRKIHYICGGNGLAAIYVQNAGLDTLYYAHTGYQGSLTALSLANGTVKERYAYDPWGNRRNPTNWTQSDSRTAFILNRGYTMHEHLPEFGLINMNGRVYDPLTSQFLSVDPYVQAPGDWLNYNRYAYCFNNPMLYTDPSGEFLGIFFRAMVFVNSALSNWINGYDNPVGRAWNTSGSLTNAVSNCAQIPIYQNSNTRFSIGLDPFALGVSANTAYMKDGHATGIGIGFGFGGFNANAAYSYTTSNGWSFGRGIGAGNNYWGWNANVTKDGVGGGYGRTYFGGEHAQILGNWSIYWRGGSFTLQNDVRFWKLGGDGGDRWRTNAFELTFGDFSIGSSLFTNDGKKASVGAEGHDDKGIDFNAVAPGFLMGKNRPIDGKPAGAWKNGQVYSAPLWLGYRVGNSVSRVGFSHWRVQNATQNFVHRWIGRQQYYLGYNNLYQGFYGYSGYYNPFSLYHK